MRAWALPSIFLVAGLSTIAIFTLAVANPSSTSEVKAKRPVQGDASAPVLIQEDGDFQCPSCGAFARGIEPQIRAAYIDTGRARTGRACAPPSSRASSRSPSGHESLGEPTVADAICDRLLAGAHRIELSAASLRRSEARTAPAAAATDGPATRP